MSNDFTLRTAFRVSAEAGAIYAAPEDLCGRSPSEVLSLAEGDAVAVRSALAAGLFLPLEVLEEDAFAGRVVIGPLTEPEEAEWIVQTIWKLDLQCGKLVIGSNLSAIERRLGISRAESFSDRVCVIDVPPGQYQVAVYGYLPGSAVAVWREEHDEAIGSWFRRTRPAQDLSRWPPWLILWCIDDADPGFEEEWETFFDECDYNQLRAKITDYVEYLFHLSPLSALPTPDVTTGYLPWKTRKPKRCPLGIPLVSHTGHNS